MLTVECKRKIEAYTINSLQRTNRKPSDPKKLPRSIDQFMPIGNEKNARKLNKNDNFDDMKELFKKRMQEYRSQQIN